MHMKHVLRAGVALVCLLWLAGTAYAQTGVVRGTVKDPSGAVIPGAKVMLLAQGTGSQRTVESGQDGAFEFVAVPVAVYTVEVESEGFKKFVQKGVAVDIGHVVVERHLGNRPVLDDRDGGGFRRPGGDHQHPARRRG